jgi:ABC-type glycerol-3-phosphate transport system substrate-binding protein
MWTGWLSERGGGTGDVEDRWPGEWKMRWGLISLPRDAQAGTLAWVLGYAISAETAHPEACWQWIAFLSQQSQASFGMVPPRKSIAESAAYEQLVGADAATVARQSMESAMLISPALVEFGDLGVYGRAINAIIEGSATPQEAMTRAQQQVTQGENQ